MYRRRILYTIGALALPGFFSACGGGDDNPTPIQPDPPPPDPAPIDLAAGWTPGQVLADAKGHVSLFSGAKLLPNGPGRMLVVAGAHSDWRVFSLNVADGRPTACPAPDFKASDAPEGGVVNAIPTTRGGVFWLGYGGDFPAYRLRWTEADGSTGQPGPIQETLLESGSWPQATLLAQDRSGQSLVRWDRGPLPENEPPAIDELLMFSAGAPDWRRIAFPDPTLSPDLLQASRTVFDQTGTAWMVQPSPGPTQDEWNLLLYSLAPNATSWSAPFSIPAESPRSKSFQMGVDAKGRVVVAHTFASRVPVSPVPLSVTRFDPAQAAWTTLRTSVMTVGYFQLHVDAPGNIWILDAKLCARYDDETGQWRGLRSEAAWPTSPNLFPYAPSDEIELTRDLDALPIATDSRGNAWVAGVRRKSSSDQDLPVLWINRFEVSTGQWGQPATLNVAGGEDPIFVASLNPGQSDDSSFRVTMAMDTHERPVVLINELVPTGWLGFWSRTWVARGPASN